MALGEDDFAEFDRGQAPEVSRSARSPSYKEGVDLPDRVPAGAPRDDPARPARRPGDHPVPRGRDREVRPRDLLLQRRRVNEPHGRRTRCLVDSPGRPPQRPRARDDGPRGRRNLRRALGGDGSGFGIINFANPDMVGHTGDIEAAIRAIGTVDGCLADVVAAVHRAGGASSSPPTTATPTTCSRRTARPTRPTR